MDHLQVLIIEDDKDTANFFSMVLSLVGFECEIVHSAKLALSRLAASQPDMILLDMRLGVEIGGEDILYQIRSNPRLDQTRVIVITAYPSMAEPITNLADLILLKPVDMDQLKTLASRLVLRDEQTTYYQYRDPVTGLFNHEFFLTRLELAFERSRRRLEFLFALMVFSVELVPLEENSYNEMDIDPIYRQVAERLRKIYRPTDTIARLDGEKFITLHEDLKNLDDLIVLDQRLRACLAPAFQIDDRHYHLHLSIGTVIHSHAYKQPTALIEAACLAMTADQSAREDLSQPVG